MTRIVALGTLLVALSLAAATHAVSFNRVVSLGDSLLDDSAGVRSPVVAEHLAQRLGAPLTKFARSGSTSTALLDQGQHAQAAAQFGAGDLAVLWIGGNDFFYSIGLQFGISGGNYGAIDTLEQNVDVAMATLRGAGLEVLALNLPDMMAPPFTDTLTLFAFQNRNVSQATLEWNRRLDALAARHGAHVVDVHTLFADLIADPADFALRGRTPTLGPSYGCQFCVFADSIHPGSFAQGFIANLAIDALNLAYVDDGAPSLDPLSKTDLAMLAGIAAADFNGDLTVTGADAALWANALGVDDRGDADGDGDTDGADILLWQRTATSAAAPAAEAASLSLGEGATRLAPEPTAATMILVAGIVGGGRARRRRGGATQ